MPESSTQTRNKSTELYDRSENAQRYPQRTRRAVGTNTLRKASNVVGFLDAACEALGHPIDVISGREEARLIYRGVVRDVEEPDDWLVIDIGGGSTELIVGENEEPTRLDSLFMGCVSWSARFFPDGVVNEERMIVPCLRLGKSYTGWYALIVRQAGTLRSGIEWNHQCHRKNSAGQRLFARLKAKKLIWNSSCPGDTGRWYSSRVVHRATDEHTASHIKRALAASCWGNSAVSSIAIFEKTPSNA